MNKSRYITRPIDATDRAIIAVLFASGRIKTNKLAIRIDMSSPSISDRILKLEDAAILGYTVIIDFKVFGFRIAVHLRVSALPGEVKRVEQTLINTPQLVEVQRITRKDCFVAEIIVRDEDEI
jgi:Lrp/AsnC family transcriptional regulator, leucine-responsive regulatory protein